MKPHISFDENLIVELSTKFDLRTPNVDALRALVRRIESGDFKPHVPLVLDVATGVGKTYVMAAFIEYLRRQGVHHVMIVTPNTVVQDKTKQDFTQGTNRYVDGFDVPPQVVTPDNVQAITINGDSHDLFAGEGASTLYIFNVQQLFPPKEGGKNEASGLEAGRRKVYRFQEESGILAQRLIERDDLVIIADESHLFGSSAKVFKKSLTSLDPAITVGLTASPDKSDTVVFRYPLWKAIRDEYVKQPVLVFRKSGYDSEERQLQDAISLLKFKEEHYAAYREGNPDKKPTRPLLFVVCADVNHATETATHLRNTHMPDTAGGPAVLQVDNQHDDLTTQAFLRNLESPTSPVRVIVSVNKLREGWDTKRIAVMCTLRAMGSEVLTQQVMGRGLRLPFGEHTGYEAIDQLDIISHKSFVSLLKNENVLREFGIEEEIPDQITLIDPDKPEPTPPVSPAPGTGADGGSSTPDAPTGSSGTTWPEGGDSTHTDENTGGTSGGMGTGQPTIGLRGLTDGEDMTPRDIPKPVVVSINEAFSDEFFLFPTTAITETQSPFKLSELDTRAVELEALRVSDSDEHLERRQLIADAEKHELTPKELERQAVRSLHQTAEQVRKELVARIFKTRGISATAENVAQAEQVIVPTFMASSRIEEWTEKSKESAVRILTELIADESKKAAKRNTRLDVTVTPKKLPVAQSFTLPPGVKVHDRLNLSNKMAGRGFAKQNYYGEWNKGLFEYARFDSFSAEYKLAQLFNFDPTVEWWTRLYDHQGAEIAYNTQQRYVPDFVVKDKDGTLWIVEGKADNKKNDPEVIQKKKAAERLIRELVSHKDYRGQKWGYVIAFEADIAEASSLVDLKNSGFVQHTPHAVGS